MPNPTMGNGVVSTMNSYNFIKSQEVYESLVKEERDTSVYNPFGNDYVNSFFRENAQEENVENIEWMHYEKTRPNQRVILSGSASASDGAAASLTVQSGSIYTVSSQSPYTASNDVDVYVPRVKEVLRFSDGTLGMVTAINASKVCTIYPFKSDGRIPATTASDVVISIGTYNEEGSGTVEPSAFRVAQFQNQLSIAKDTVKFTDVAESITTWIDDKWTFKMFQWKEMLTKFNNELDARLLVGETITNTNLLAIYPEMPAGDGYLTYIENFGYDRSYTSAVGITLSDVDSLLAKADEIGAPSEYVLMGGFDPRKQVHDLLRDTSGDAAFATFVGGKDQAVNLNFNSLYRMNYSLHLKSSPIFSHPELLGAAGHDTRDMLLFMPAKGSVQTGDGRKANLKVKCLNKTQGYQGGYHERFRSGTESNDLDEHLSIYDVSARKGIDAYGQEIHMRLKAA